MISFMVCTFASGVGFLLAAILKPNAALIAGVILPTTAGAMFSGLIAAVPNWLSYLSFIRFATEWFLISELWAIDTATGFDPADPNGLSLTTIFLMDPGAQEKGYHRGSPARAAVSLLFYAMLFRLGAVIALHVVNNDRAIFFCRVCCCARKRRKNLASARYALSHGESADSSAAAALQQRLTAPAPEESEAAAADRRVPAAKSSAAFELLRASSIRELDLRTRTRTLRFKLPLDSCKGQEIAVAHPTTGETVAVTVPAGAAPGAFISVRYVAGPAEEDARPPPPPAGAPSAPNPVVHATDERAERRGSANGFGAVEE